MDGPIVDAWMQHPTPRFIQQPMFESLWRWVGKDKIPDDLDPKLTIQLYRSAEVDTALACAWHGPQGAMITNDEVADLVDQAPDLFAGIGSVDLSQPMEAVREARRCIEELGFCGIRVVPWLWDLPPDDRRYYPLYAELVEQDVPFCTQVGHAGPLMPSEPGRPIPYLDHVALEFPELTIVAGHIGHPWTEEMLALATKHENVHIDTSAYKPKRYPDALVAAMTGHLQDKILFGTNYPMLLPGDCLDGLDALDLDEATRRAFLGENAVRVFGV